MKRVVLLLALVLITSALSAQSRYLPLGLNGTSLLLSSTFGGSGLDSAEFEAGYSFGGRMDISMSGGVVVDQIDSSPETIPTVLFQYDLVIIKQQSTVPISVSIGAELGFSTASPDGRSLFGTGFGFDMDISYNFPFERLFLGVDAVWEFRKTNYSLTLPDDSVSVERMFFGAGIDVGYRFDRKNLLVLKTEILWDLDGQLYARLNLRYVIAKVY